MKNDNVIKLPTIFLWGRLYLVRKTEGAYNVGGRLRSYWDMWVRP